MNDEIQIYVGMVKDWINLDISRNRERLGVDYSYELAKVLYRLVISVYVLHILLDEKLLFRDNIKLNSPWKTFQQVSQNLKKRTGQ